MNEGRENIVNEIYIWGAGGVLKRYFDQIPSDLKVKGIIDNDVKKHGEYCVAGTKLECFGKEKLTQGDRVVIAVENPEAVKEISAYLDEKGIDRCHLFDIVDKAFLESGKTIKGTKKPGKIRKFIDVTVPISNCNMKCDYCYLSHLNVEMGKAPDIYHDARYIRAALSQERLGGSAFINLCGVGETLLCKNVPEIVSELLDEGHYVQIVTNMITTGVIRQIAASSMDFSRLFFKCSFHYEELLRMNLLDKFAENVKTIESCGASYSVEYVPVDESVRLIPEIKKFCLDNFGALPHVTVTRDERYPDFRLLTSLSKEEYKKAWGVFESEMFDFKIENVGKRYDSPCKAGVWAGELNLATGDLYKCTNNPLLCNIYQKIDEPIIWEEVGDKCCCAYCFNNHAYMTLGLMPDVDAPTYLAMRDRVKTDGTHWVGKTLRDVFSQKLSENNK